MQVCEKCGFKLNSDYNICPQMRMPCNEQNDSSLDTVCLILGIISIITAIASLKLGLILAVISFIISSIGLSKYPRNTLLIVANIISWVIMIIDIVSLLLTFLPVQLL